MKVSSNRDDVIVTHALGSCLGIAVHDPVARVGGLLHVMLPSASVDRDKAKTRPTMFVDTGVPLLFRQMYDAGAQRDRIVVKVAGGGTFGDANGFFAIGKRNVQVFRKLMWKNNLMITAQEVGGQVSRTLSLEIATGLTVLSTGGKKWEL
jgi:chemotaxis protein CheD